MELQTNCKNCGAPLNYSKVDYGKIAKCVYCDTEYHIDLLGRVEEYKVKLKIMGEVKEFYISEIKVHPLYFDNTYIGADGRMTNVINHKIKVELIEL